jgi:hypothetical protein
VIKALKTGHGPTKMENNDDKNLFFRLENRTKSNIELLEFHATKK